jgi:hypothetical protein
MKKKKKEKETKKSMTFKRNWKKRIQIPLPDVLI